MLRARTLAALLLAATTPAAAQNASVRTFTLTAPVELEADFTKVSAVRELRDGRVLITDSQEKSVMIGDFTSRKAQQVARRGEGPEEYGTPVALFAVGDSIF